MLGFRHSAAAVLGDSILSILTSLAPLVSLQVSCRLSLTCLLWHCTMTPSRGWISRPCSAPLRCLEPIAISGTVVHLLTVKEMFHFATWGTWSAVTRSDGLIAFPGYYMGFCTLLLTAVSLTSLYQGPVGKIHCLNEIQMPKEIQMITYLSYQYAFSLQKCL